jgi:hypothetical protein
MDMQFPQVSIGDVHVDYRAISGWASVLSDGRCSCRLVRLGGIRCAEMATTTWGRFLYRAISWESCSACIRAPARRIRVPRPFVPTETMFICRFGKLHYFVYPAMCAVGRVTIVYGSKSQTVPRVVSIDDVNMMPLDIISYPREKIGERHAPTLALYLGFLWKENRPAYWESQ